MARKRYRYDPETRKCYEIDLDAPPAPRSGPYIASDYQAYDCPITGRSVDGKREHRENLKQHNCRVLEPGETREAPKRSEEAFNTAVDRAVDKMMPV
ncbi:hypothetical protein [Thalassospira lohafexi]|uniref:Uncharacterized protein n=1 Tax=Thalassospira lohafexi TaxID=744227 RepID=A0A2N3L0M4_9PROT|nr:hypothetical protein [Thalassospira lohafexi]PKR56351.1 hypothetical protein COO92_21335 [Thalassospira lohafexi]